MSRTGRVAWKDGMFLLPQHFQQAERSLEHRSQQRLLGSHPLSWGVIELRLDEQSLRQGCVALKCCRLLWPDGTPLDAPEHDPLPPPLSLPIGGAEPMVELFLALPLRNPQLPLATCSTSRRDIRFIEQPLEVADELSPEERQTIDIALPNLRLLRNPTELDGQLALKLAEVERTAEGGWALNTRYWPPSLLLSGMGPLLEALDALLQRMSSRSEQLVSRTQASAAQPASPTQLEPHSLGLLITLRSQLAILRHLRSALDTHPARIYEELLRLSGALQALVCSLGSLAPAYRHDAPAESFLPLLGQLHQLIQLAARDRYAQVPLTQSRHVWEGLLRDGQLQATSELYLIASGELEPLELERLPSVCKVATSSRVENLARTASPGLELIPLPRPPTALARQERASYFQLRREGSLWQEVTRSGQLAIFVPRAPVGLKLELFSLMAGAQP